MFELRYYNKEQFFIIETSDFPKLSHLNGFINFLYESKLSLLNLAIQEI